MHKLNISRTQWAVGNGFFHSGYIESGLNRITYVYDCGALAATASQNALDRELQAFSARHEHVDVFFVSHFDFDHISGIDRLASATSVAQFVIPLLPAPQRLLAYARQLRSGALDTNQNNPSMEFYLSLIANPIEALSSLTEGRGGRDDDAVIAIEVEDEPLDASDVDSDQNMVDEHDYPAPELLNPRSVGSAKIGELDLKKDGARFTISAASSAVWEWKFHVAQQALQGSTEFTNSLSRQGLGKQIKDLGDPAAVLDLVMNHRPALIKAYDDATAAVGKSFTRNITSLMLYSGPPLNRPHRTYRTRPNVVERAEIGAWSPRPGWLGLGDADIRSVARLNNINNIWAHYKPNVSTFAPSHHGSRHDWHAQLTNGFGAGADYPPTFVFSASGRWGHPAHEVLLEVNDLGGTAVIVGLDVRSRWTESLTAYVGS